MVKQYFELSLNFKLSKNFNSIGGEIKYGREAKPNETKEQLFKDVENTVIKKLNETMQIADKLL